MTYRPYIFGDDITTTFDESVRFGSLGQTDAGTRRTSVSDHADKLVEPGFLRKTGGKNNIDDVFFNFLIHVYILHYFTGTNDIFGFQNSRCLREGFLHILTNDQLFFFFFGVIDHYFQHKTVDLGFR